MSDLVKRLRDYDRTTAAKDMVEAAARIEALEAALRQIGWLLEYGEAMTIVRTTLAPEPEK